MTHCLTCCLAKQNKTWAKLRVRASSLRSFMRVQTKNKSFFWNIWAFLEKKIDLSLPYDDKSSGPICFPLWDMAWLWGSLEKSFLPSDLNLSYNLSFQINAMGTKCLCSKQVFLSLCFHLTFPTKYFNL